MSIKATVIASALASTVAATDVSAEKNVPDQIPANAPPVKMIFQSALGGMDQAFEMSHKMMASQRPTQEAKFQSCLDTAASAYKSPTSGLTQTIDTIEKSMNTEFEFIAPQTSQNFLEAATGKMEGYLQQCVNTYKGQVISTEQAEKIEEAHAEASQTFIDKMQPLGQHEDFTKQPDITIPKVNIPSFGGSS